MSKPRIDSKKLQIGEYLSEIQYYKVVRVSSTVITVANERGFESEVDKAIVEEGMYSASQYQSEKTVTRTEICEILERAGNHVFTVHFTKQIQEKELKNKLLKMLESEEGSPLKPKDIEKAIKQQSKEIIKGEERTLVGHLIEVEQKMGRSLVIDLEVPSDQHRLRQVDHRTIDWLILKNVKYIVK
jgi:hypothetical protein